MQITKKGGNNLISFNQDGITVILTHSKIDGFTFYEEEAKKENECFIKPIQTEKRLKAFQERDVLYFQMLYQKEEGIPFYDAQNNLAYIAV